MVRCFDALKGSPGGNVVKLLVCRAGGFGASWLFFL